MATIEEEPTTLLGYFIMALKVTCACLMCPWICGSASATLLLVAPAAVSTCRIFHVVAVFYCIAVPTFLTLNIFIASFIVHPFQLMVAASPLIALGCILFTAFEDPEAEALKRRKKGDFQLDGHGE
jgi:hypothetical protein